MKYSKDNVVSFDEKKHVYRINDKKLISVTEYISKYKTYFDSELIAGKYAKKHNLKKEDVLAIWKEKGEKSCIMGSFVHKIFEDYILGNEIEINEEYLKCNIAKKFIDDCFESGRLIPLETEYIVYNDELAGQIDCIVKNTKGDHFILDWKTNSDISYENRWQNMTGKYSHLEDCSFNHYSLQLGLYKQMCKEYEIKDCFIVHLKEDNYEFIKVKNIL